MNYFLFVQKKIKIKIKIPSIFSVSSLFNYSFDQLK